MSNPDSILLAEDDAQYAFILQIALRQAGITCPVHVVASREELVNYLTGEEPFGNRQEYPPPSVIILGLRLPLLNDFRTLRWIRQRPEFNEIHIAVLSGMEFDEEGEIAHQLGANSYDPKPSDFGELLHIVERIRDQWLARREHREAA